MKKILVVILSFICLISSTVCLGACSNKGNATGSTELIDLADCEIGYELPIYPTCEFDYKVNEECTVHIKNINIKLVQKNEISSNNEVTGKFFPFVLEVNAEGETTDSLAGKTIALHLRDSFPVSFVYSGESVVNTNGTINWKFNVTDISVYKILYFYRIVI